jgi:hypothetical protein
VSGRPEADLLGPDRRLLAADPLSRELAISCGAALYNLRLAFRVMGHDVAVWLLPDAVEKDTGYVAELNRWTRDRNPGAGVPAAAVGAHGTTGDAPVRVRKTAALPPAS